MKTKKQSENFWVTNTSPMNVSLADLNLTIKAFSSVNLLDNRHYQYNKEQLEKSVASGSIFKKRDKIVVRKLTPQIVKVNVPLSLNAVIPSRERSTLEIKQEHYEELNVSDEDFAKENADIIELDSKVIQKA